LYCIGPVGAGACRRHVALISSVDGLLTVACSGYSYA